MYHLVEKISMFLPEISSYFSLLKVFWGSLSSVGPTVSGQKLSYSTDRKVH